MNHSKLLESKLLIPRILYSFVEREELFQVLEDATAEGKRIILNAGAGFGKTCLLVYYTMKAPERSCAWYRLDVMDNDLETFVTYLTCSIQKVIPDFQFDLQQCQTDNRVSAISLAYDFALALTHISVESLSIILDDFQEIKNENVITFLSILFDNISDKIRFLIAMKGAFPDFWLRYFLNGNLKMLGSEALAFSSEEMEALVGRCSNVRDVKACAEILARYTEGWPAGVAAVLFCMNQIRDEFGSEEMKQMCDAGPANDYLMYEIFRKLPYEIQLFLINTSILSVLNVDICNEILDIQNAKLILDDLVKQNLFVSRFGGTGELYRYHPALRVYLQMRLSAEKKKDLCKKVSLYSLEREMHEQAVEYAMESEDTELLQLAVKRDREGIREYEAQSDGQIKIRRLVVSCFGAFQVKVEGTDAAIQFRTKKAKELFAFLYDQQGRKVSRDTIIEALWPEMGWPSVSTLFYTTASYMRKALLEAGCTDIIFQEKRMYYMNMERIFSPRVELECITGRKPDREALISDIYKGAYLENIQNEWVAGRREYFERFFMKISRIQADTLMKVGRFEDAIQVLSQALMTDEYEEQISAMLIECYGKIGDMRNARRHFEQTQKLLKEELGIDTSVEVISAYRRVMEKKS